MFGRAIVAHRLRLGLTQEALADKAGLSTRGLRDLEVGRVRTPRMSSVAALAEALGLHGEEREGFFLAAYVETAAGTAAPWEPPRQLPADVRAFTGRARELAVLDGLLSEDGADAGSPLGIVAVTGTAGVGKTGLVVHWAHGVRHRFPDGQLYLDLRGHDSDQPLAPAEALARLLVSLGVREQDIPIDVEERATRYRMAVADRRALILLDNAVSAEQVRLLLPSSRSSTVLVTSRDHLAGLVAVHGAHRIDLDLLPQADALLLLRRLIGIRAGAEPAAAATLVQQCARLPLALRVAAELVSRPPSRSLADLVGELVEHRRRLDLLDAGGYSRADVTTVFSWSLQHLPATAVRAFRLLGLHPGSDFDVAAAAAVTGTTLRQVGSSLGTLARANLVQAKENGRYGMHDLLRAYASSLAAAHAGTDSPDAALDRLLDHYLAAAAAAMDGLFPAERHRRPPPPERPTALPELESPQAARTWLDGERATLVEIARYAATHDRAGHAVRLSTTLFRYLASGHYSDGLIIHEHARHAAGAVGDPSGEGHALLGLIDAHVALGRRQTAGDLAQRALRLFRQVADRSGEERARYSLGMIDWMSGRYDRALEHAESALAIAREVDGIGEAKAHTLFGLVALHQGRLEHAQARFQASATLYQGRGDRSGLAYTLDNLGRVEAARRRHREAAELQKRALALFQQLGDRAGQAMTLEGLAAAHAGLDEPDQAVDALEQALSIARDIGDRRTEPAALNRLGDVLHHAGRHLEAIAHYTAAAEVAHDVDAPFEEAQARAGLGEACLALSEPEQARVHYKQALALYQELDVPEADRIHARLDALDQ